jgi:hypothetical protein
MTVYIPTALRARARAAYRGTLHLEGDRSFSHMIEKLLEAGITERELQHNNGQPFSGGTDQLSAGRPLSGD